MPIKVISLFQEIEKPDEAIIILLLNACAHLKTDQALKQVKIVLPNIPESFYSNVRLITSLLDALMKCGDVTSAETFFIQSTRKDLSMYGAMMKGISSFVYQADIRNH